MNEYNKAIRDKQQAEGKIKIMSGEINVLKKTIEGHKKTVASHEETIKKQNATISELTAYISKNCANPKTSREKTICSQKQQQKTNLEQSNKNLSNQITSLNTLIGRLEGQIKQKNDNIATWTKKIEEYTKYIKEYDACTESLKGKLIITSPLMSGEVKMALEVGKRAELYKFSMSMPAPGKAEINEIKFDTAFGPGNIELDDWYVTENSTATSIYPCRLENNGQFRCALERIESGNFGLENGRVQNYSLSAVVKDIKEPGSFKIYGISKEGVLYNGTRRDADNQTQAVKIYYDKINDLPVCGNGNKEDNEQCDDGNIKDDDGCSSQCYLEKIDLNSVTIDNSNVILDYKKNFDTCAHLYNAETLQIMHTENLFCQNVGIVTVPLSKISGLQIGDKVYMIHGNNGNVKSQINIVADGNPDICDVAPDLCPTKCGDGVIQKNEECDDGMKNGSNYKCSSECKLQIISCSKFITEDSCNDNALFNNLCYYKDNTCKTGTVLLGEISYTIPSLTTPEGSQITSNVNNPGKSTIGIPFYITSGESEIRGLGLKEVIGAGLADSVKFIDKEKNVLLGETKFIDGIAQIKNLSVPMKNEIGQLILEITYKPLDFGSTVKSQVSLVKMEYSDGADVRQTFPFFNIPSNTIILSHTKPLLSCNTLIGSTDCLKQDGCYYNEKTSKCTSEALKCEDASDDQDDIFTKGMIWGFARHVYSPRYYQASYDYCTGDTINQVSCDSEGFAKYTSTTCPNGCSDGACKASKKDEIIIHRNGNLYINSDGNLKQLTFDTIFDGSNVDCDTEKSRYSSLSKVNDVYLFDKRIYQKGCSEQIIDMRKIAVSNNAVYDVGTEVQKKYGIDLIKFPYVSLSIVQDKFNLVGFFVYDNTEFRELHDSGRLDNNLFISKDFINKFGLKVNLEPTMDITNTYGKPGKFEFSFPVAEILK